ncbi:LLM class flavin-dependent oxidoreductase [Mycobacterium koreense]|uniref:LLM class F420-dependent oxidoreductase n=1 Tax=Mycolicibacillus koreensis TaxID=1069220 RepID=A0A7I7SEM8_9MYCO|nr:LLM class flavin-dependent oxidoreductase [Mycolicibacillus koreensis]MCV7248055.1 LLM class flavin-dependent oxidoreductase [Mycolicibacillus koreensis]OSC35818.1 LLM class F420-dependent oxidoreductase [Mycolicibacillus koreensis]BBY54990.1 luciferase-like protein [Mycolicibacillus koreensis]
MRWSISIPQFDLTGDDAPALRSYLARAEALGFEGGWTLEQALGAAPVLAPLEVLAYAAACTERLRLGVAVLVSTVHDPLQLAAAATTIDRLSGGRLDLGIGTGGPSRRFAAFGVERATFIARFTEGVELMKAAWSPDPRISFTGRFRQLEDVAIAPKPIQRPHPPLWFGGHADAALARAVRHGDGFMGAGSATTAAFAEQVGVLRRELAAQGRDGSGFRIGKRVYVTVDADADRARQRVLAGIDRIYGGRLRDAAAVAVAGTAADVAGGLAAVIDAGAETVVLNPVGAGVPEDHDQMEQLAAEVLPQLL